jgi:2-iminobutanoate/2-iminopropanoate deaminase
MAKSGNGKTVFGGKLAIPLSKAIRAGDFVYCSGEVALDAKGVVTSGGIEAETRHVLESLKATLKSAGCTLEDVVKTTVFIADARDFGRFNKVYAEYFPKDPPARSTVRADLMIDAKIEIEVIAYKPE